MSFHFLCLLARPFISSLTNRCIYSPFAAPESEAFASDFVFEFRLELQTPSLSCLRCLLFRPLSSRIALAGLRRVFSRARARVSESRATDECGDPELEGYLLGQGDTEVLFSSVLDIRFAVVVKGPRAAHVDSSRVLSI